MDWVSFGKVLFNWWRWSARAYRQFEWEPAAPTDQMKFIFHAWHKLVHLCLVWCRVVKSRDVSPHKFWWSRNVWRAQRPVAGQTVQWVSECNVRSRDFVKSMQLLRTIAVSLVIQNAQLRIPVHSDTAACLVLWLWKCEWVVAWLSLYIQSIDHYFLLCHCYSKQRVLALLTAKVILATRRWFTRTHQ